MRYIRLYEEFIASMNRTKMEASVEFAYLDLPDDMQTLIFQLAEGVGIEIQDDVTFPVKEIPIANFPHVEIGNDDRGEKHAEAMIGLDMPPVLVWKNVWLDGRHRLWAARRSGLKIIRAIDISNVVNICPNDSIGNIMPMNTTPINESIIYSRFLHHKA